MPDWVAEGAGFPGAVIKGWQKPSVAQFVLACCARQVKRDGNPMQERFIETQ